MEPHRYELLIHWSADDELYVAEVLDCPPDRSLVWAALPGHNSRMPSVLDLELTRLRAMTASEKVAVMHSLWRQARSLTLAGVRGRHPDWTPERVEAEAREILRRDPK